MRSVYVLGTACVVESSGAYFSRRKNMPRDDDETISKGQGRDSIIDFP